MFIRYTSFFIRGTGSQGRCRQPVVECCAIVLRYSAVNRYGFM
ncbi:hypothetical protein [Prevotella pectinovora]|nr:hypothetical protein [Prevotella pectinovora]